MSSTVSLQYDSVASTDDIKCDKCTSTDCVESSTVVESTTPLLKARNGIKRTQEDLNTKDGTEMEVSSTTMEDTSEPARKKIKENTLPTYENSLELSPVTTFQNSSYTYASQFNLEPTEEIQNSLPTLKTFIQNIPHVALEPTEEEIKENLIKHRKEIQNSLCPSELYHFCDQLSIEECATNDPQQRKEASRRIVQTVIEQREYTEFLRSLTKETKHMGHSYIVSLLRGEEFGSDEEVRESKQLLEKFRDHHEMIEKYLDVNALIPSLHEKCLITAEEIEVLRNVHYTTREKIRQLLTILKTKGPTAHYIFVNECLEDEDTPVSHNEIYHTLTEEDTQTLSEAREERKRQTRSKRTRPTKVTKRNPCFLENPDCLRAKQYLSEVSDMRRYHLCGKEYWDQAEAIYDKVMEGPEYPKEIQIAILLESCTMHITNKQPILVEDRVRTARLKCKKLYKLNTSNVDILVARCDWVQAKLYRYTKDYNKALEKIKSAMYYSYQYCEGEERALIEYCHACILLGKEDKTPNEEKRAIEGLNTAIRCANSGDYGLDISHCILRLAQAHVGSSTSNTGKKRGEVSKHDIAEARRVLGDIKAEKLSTRTRCMLLYTRSDVYRVAGQLEQAADSARESLQIAQRHNFRTEIASAELRLKRLEED